MSRSEPQPRDDRAWPKNAVAMSTVTVLAALAVAAYFTAGSDRPLLTAAVAFTGLAIGLSLLMAFVRRWLAGEQMPSSAGVISIFVTIGAVALAALSGIKNAVGAMLAGIVAGMMLANIWAVRAARANRN